MKSVSLHKRDPGWSWEGRLATHAAARPERLASLRQWVLPATVTALAVTAALLLATWAASGHAVDVLSATVAVSSYVLFALGVDASGRRMPLYFATGLALALLGWLARNVAAEFGVVGVGLLAAWLAPLLFRKLVGLRWG